MLLNGIPLFDDKNSVFHFLLGFWTYLLGNVGLLLLAFFLVYEAREQENVYNKLGDMLEFAIGFILCGFIFLTLTFI